MSHSPDSLSTEIILKRDRWVCFVCKMNEASNMVAPVAVDATTKMMPRKMLHELRENRRTCIYIPASLQVVGSEWYNLFQVGNSDFYMQHLIHKHLTKTLESNVGTAVWLVIKE